MTRETVFPPQMKPPRSPLSPAIKANGLVFCSGQLPLNAETGEIARGGIREQTKQALSNLQRILLAAGTDLERSLKVTVYMTDLSDFDAMNDVYRGFFTASAPARTTIGVASLSRSECLVEIDLIAML